MSEAERIEGLFKKVSAFPDFMEVSTIANDCIDTVHNLECQLDLAKVNERDLNDIITALNEDLSKKEKIANKWKNRWLGEIKRNQELSKQIDILEEEQLKEKGDEETPT